MSCPILGYFKHVSTIYLSCIILTIYYVNYLLNQFVLISTKILAELNVDSRVPRSFENRNFKLKLAAVHGRSRAIKGNGVIIWKGIRKQRTIRRTIGDC